MDAKPRCKATTKSDQPCKARPLTDSDFCLAHADEETREKLGFGGAQEGAGRPRLPRAVEVLKERIEDDIDAYLAPIEDALTAEQAIVKRRGDGNGGFWEEIEMVTDHGTRLKASVIALDRVYGRPKQATEISGPDGDPVGLGVIFDSDTAEAARAVLRRTSASSGD